MGFWRSPFGAMVMVVLAAIGVACGATAFQVQRHMTPARQAVAVFDFESMLMSVESVEFESADGIALSGWLMPGRPDLPPLVLCHDLGQSKASLINLAIALRKAGFTVLLFDQRGHGESAGDHSTLGLKEKRDLLGAVDFLAAHQDIDARRIGVYGAGMGAHAAVLAAADRPALKVLVLDALYPDVAYPLVRQVYNEWPFAVAHFEFLPRSMFTLIAGARPGESRAADVIGGLLGRDLLLIAPAGDSALTDQMQRMYEAVPPQADFDPNLVVLPAIRRDGLYDENLSRYHERVTDFFSSRFADPAPVSG